MQTEWRHARNGLAARGARANLYRPVRRNARKLASEARRYADSASCISSQQRCRQLPRAQPPLSAQWEAAAAWPSRAQA